MTKNNHFFVYSTRDGFGSDETFDPTGNPLLQESEFIISGQKALVNDLFRVVHDYFGHAKEGVGFRAGGEENAYRSHAAMFSPLALKALATETRGQNSFLNFGPEGEVNLTASQEDTLYSDQKTGLLPEWAIRVDDRLYQFLTTGTVDRMPQEFRELYGTDILYQQAAKNELGLYSAVEQAVLDMNIPAWKLQKKNYTKEMEIERESLTQELNEMIRTGTKPAGPIFENTEQGRRVKELDRIRWADEDRMPTAKGKDIWGKLKTAKGLKAEEFKWLGIEEFLMVEPEKKFTRSQVAEFIRTDGVRVEKIVAEETERDEAWQDDEQSTGKAGMSGTKTKLGKAITIN